MMPSESVKWHCFKIAYLGVKWPWKLLFDVSQILLGWRKERSFCWGTVTMKVQEVILCLFVIVPWVFTHSLTADYRREHKLIDMSVGKIVLTCLDLCTCCGAVRLKQEVAVLKKSMCQNDLLQRCCVNWEEKWATHRTLRYPSDRLMWLWHSFPPRYPEGSTSDIDLKPVGWSSCDARWTGIFWDLL